MQMFNTTEKQQNIHLKTKNWIGRYKSEKCVTLYNISWGYTQWEFLDHLPFWDLVVEHVSKNSGCWKGVLSLRVELICFKPICPVF